MTNCMTFNYLKVKNDNRAIPVLLQVISPFNEVIFESAIKTNEDDMVPKFLSLACKHAPNLSTVTQTAKNMAKRENCDFITETHFI